ncbi:DEAD/DEAH box helicase family protein [Francisella salimarina]|uniref:restriction endonuclease n=1 Tax=Francisella salimarina TaxID=2599927 RepID=UPI003D81A0A9
MRNLFKKGFKKLFGSHEHQAQEITFNFDHNQEHQLFAIESTLELFDGFEKQEPEDQDRSAEFEFGVISNVSDDDALEDFEEELYDNYQRVREVNKSRTSSFGAEDDLLTEITFESGRPLDGTKNCLHPVRYPRFTIEMETGTGKTYTYLRSMYEMYQKFGFCKFIIVVPSVAIYEGVKKSYQIMLSDFVSKYNENMIFIEYDGQKTNQLKAFAENDGINVMLMTIQSFDKLTNNIYKSSEGFENAQPYEFIQATRPILILDESQNYLTDNARTALHTLNPLFAICYSATPKERPNLIYRVTPVDAFQRGLTKRIEVVGIEDLVETMDDKTLALDSIIKKPLSAVLKASVKKGATFEVENITVKVGNDLAQKTKNDAYSVGYVVSEINAKKGQESIRFENGRELYLKQSTAAMLKEELFRLMIRETIQTHFEKQKSLAHQGIKVLSLFFIDKVANYQPQDGFIRTVFEDEFARAQREFESDMDLVDSLDHLLKVDPKKVHEGYFAKTPKTKKKDSEAVDDFSEISSNDRAKAEKQAYELIMKEKGRLLNVEEPVSFIFAHSALKEGWDNPNVFQICTLNQTKSEPKKRQEIGRGLRLCVDQAGNRITDSQTNILTVIANESYQSYADRLQKDYEEDGDIKSAEKMKPSQKDKGTAKRNNQLFESQAFKQFWRTLQQKADYEIVVDTDNLVEEAVRRLNRADFREQKFSKTKGRFIISKVKIELLKIDSKKDAATINVELFNTEETQKQGGESQIVVGSVLSQRIKDDALKGFKVVRIDRDEKSVTFANGRKLIIGEPPIDFDMQVNNQINDKKAQVIGDKAKRQSPIVDFFDRVQKEVQLTRKTILEILKKMESSQVDFLIKNPEGFISEFTKKLKVVVAEHVANNITFIKKPDLEEDRDLDEIFPDETKFVQTEIIEGNDKRSLYDKVQIDSEVEKNFVETFLNIDSNVFVFFKFPPKFKIRLPKIIGNYNPDWGILRWHEQESQYEIMLYDQSKPDGNKHLIQMVRETKGTVDTAKLQFAHEGWKIVCGQKYFKELGINYGVTDGKRYDWV